MENFNITGYYFLKVNKSDEILNQISKEFNKLPENNGTLIVSKEINKQIRNELFDNNCLLRGKVNSIEFKKGQLKIKIDKNETFFKIIVDK